MYGCGDEDTTNRVAILFRSPRQAGLTGHHWRRIMGNGYSFGRYLSEFKSSHLG